MQSLYVFFFIYYEKESAFSPSWDNLTIWFLFHGRGWVDYCLSVLMCNNFLRWSVLIHEGKGWDIALSKYLSFLLSGKLLLTEVIRHTWQGLGSEAAGGTACSEMKPWRWQAKAQPLWDTASDLRQGKNRNSPGTVEEIQQEGWWKSRKKPMHTKLQPPALPFTSLERLGQLQCDHSKCSACGD